MVPYRVKQQSIANTLVCFKIHVQRLNGKKLEISGDQQDSSMTPASNSHMSKLCLCRRAAIAPFLAAKEMGLDSFKWVLYGDDDTVFFVDGALDALDNLDYKMPYLLSDDVWFVEDDGKTSALSCVNCHLVTIQLNSCSTHLHLPSSIQVSCRLPFPFTVSFLTVAARPARLKPQVYLCLAILCCHCIIPLCT